MANPPHLLSRPLIWTMTFAAGASVANLYYNQPLLVGIADGFHASAQAIGWMPMLTQVGYALGMLFFVPLGDLTERRRLIVGMQVAVTFALVLSAVSPNLMFLLASSLLVGVTTIVPQLILPFAAQLSAPTERGRVVGTLMGGLLIGVLVARTFSGFVGHHLGWRTVYWSAAALMALLAAVLARLLPKSEPTLSISYAQLLGSVLKLIREQRVLQEASVIGGMLFGAFSAFWTTLVFLLAGPPYHQGSQVAGLFGLVGVTGAIAAPLVGRVADARSPRLTVGLGIVVSLGAFVVLWAFGHRMSGLVVGVILLDLGVQAAQVSNQARIYSLPQEVHGRLNTAYMVSYFAGGAFGSTLGATAWSHFGWNGVGLIGLSMSALALATYLVGDRASNRV